MWNYLKGLLRIGIPLENIWLAFWALLFDAMAVAGLAAMVNGTPQAILAAAFCAVPGLLLTIDVIGRFGRHSPVPYWAKKFGRNTVFRLLAEDDFTHYVCKDGTVVRNVSVSKSGRWVRVKGRYYPISLIKGIDFRYKSDSCESIIMIDGERVRDQDWICGKKVKKALSEIIGDTDAYDDRDYKEAFKAITGGDYQKLATANWDDIRYEWEQKCVELQYKGVGAKNRGRMLKQVTDPNKVRQNFLERPLSDDELDAVADSVRRKKIKDITPFLNVEKYKDEMCIFNGVKLLDRLGYPDNIKGEDFLFDCIKDIRDPYCDDAIKVLSEFGGNRLIQRIDAEIQFAYEENDLLYAAALISLSKAIGHELSINKETSQDAVSENAESETAAAETAGSETIAGEVAVAKSYSGSTLTF